MRWLLVALIVLAPIQASGKGIPVAGMGQASCGDLLTYVEARLEFAEDEIHQWVLGFLTAHNYYHNSELRIGDGAGVKHFIRKYCGDNPLHRIFMAAAALIEQLGGPKTAHQWLGRL